MINAHQELWLKYLGEFTCLAWVNKMEDELLEEVEIYTPTEVDYSLPYPYSKFEPMVYTLFDIARFARKGRVLTRNEVIFG